MDQLKQRTRYSRTKLANSLYSVQLAKKRTPHLSCTLNFPYIGERVVRLYFKLWITDDKQARILARLKLCA